MANPPPLAFPRVLILGLGLLGGSFALALARAGLAHTCLGFDADPQAQALALERGLVGAAWNRRGPAEPFDLVFLAVPPSQVPAALAGLAPWLGPDTLISDACSVKVPVIEALRTALGARPGLLPSHPIAGSHRAGPGAACPDLFQGRTVVLTPLPETSARALAAGHHLWAALGARTQVMAPAEHDRRLALLSHLPHLLAFACADQVRAAGLNPDQAGPGFQDFTRIAQAPAELWADILLENRAPVLAWAAQFRDRLAGLERALAQGDRVQLKASLARAAAWRSQS